MKKVASYLASWLLKNYGYMMVWLYEIKFKAYIL